MRRFECSCPRQAVTPLSGTALGHCTDAPVGSADRTHCVACPSRRTSSRITNGEGEEESYCTGDSGGGSLISRSFSTDRTPGIFINCGIFFCSMNPFSMRRRGSAEIFPSPRDTQAFFTRLNSAMSSITTSTGTTLISFSHAHGGGEVARRAAGLQCCPCELAPIHAQFRRGGRLHLPAERMRSELHL
jgi:hypothetical protein